MRYYDPNLGRYITTDPIGLAGGMNPYIYTGGDPVDWVDPWGLYKSPWYLQWVPGQHMWDRSLTSFEHGQYGWGAAYLAGMVGEQALVVLTLGQGSSVSFGSQCIVEESTTELPTAFNTGQSHQNYVPNTTLAK